MLLLNGPPGVGKSTLAERYHSEHPLSLLVDFDELRFLISDWSQDPVPRLARDLGFAMVRAHLAAGHDVVAAQFSIRESFFATLDGVVVDTSAELQEVILAASCDTVSARFLARREERARANGRDVAADIPIDGIAEVIRWAQDELAAIASTRPHTKIVPVDDDIEASYRRLVAALDRR